MEPSRAARGSLSRTLWVTETWAFKTERGLCMEADVTGK